MKKDRFFTIPEIPRALGKTHKNYKDALKEKDCKTFLEGKEVERLRMSG